MVPGSPFRHVYPLGAVQHSRPGEWIRSYERISIEDYQQYFDEFDPVDFDPRAWAKAAKQAGMRYAVFTAKHHDGFACMTASTRTTRPPTPRQAATWSGSMWRRSGAEGLKVGLYFSIIDWYHPDYPPLATGSTLCGTTRHTAANSMSFDNYLRYMHAQIEELVTNYGQIDLLWFDFSYDELCGEAWRATDLVRMVRRHQPQVLIDNRLEVSGEGFGSLITEHPNEYCGDFVSPEQIIPPHGVVDYKGDPVPWEACITMNNNWCFHATDRFYKPAPMLVRKLVECVSKGATCC